MSIGLTEVGGADSDTMLQSFKSLVQDLADSCSQHEVQRDVKVAKLVTSITNNNLRPLTTKNRLMCNWSIENICLF